MPKASDIAAREGRDYARMDDLERCAYAGQLLHRTWYARVYFGDQKAEELVANGFQVARWQQIPAWMTGDDGIRTHCFIGGRGGGKTACATGWVVPELLMRPNLRVGVLGPDFKVSVGVGIKGVSGIRTKIDAFDPSLVKRWDDVKSILYLVNGSIVFCYSSENQRSIEGEEFHLYWMDEVAEMHHAGGENCVWRKRAEPGIRLLGDNGEPIRKIITGTPEATPLIEDLWKSTAAFPDKYRWTQLATRDNIDNLDAEMVEQMYLEAGDSLFAKMKLEGELILESPNAMLSESDLARVRIDSADDLHQPASKMQKVILSIDASHVDNKKSDECGIIVLGRHGRRAHVLADASGRLAPRDWGERIIDALIRFPEIEEMVVEDDKSLVIEVVENVLKERLREVGRPVKITRISHRNKSKKARAEPVAVEYQLRHVLHDPSQRVPEWSDLSSLEWQWKAWNPKDPKAKSPDRLDACVYGVTHLLLSDPAPTTFHRAGA